MADELVKRKKRVPTPPHILDAWKAYRDNPNDQDIRSLLANHYQFLVKNIVKRFWTKKPAILDIDDLVQAGNLGLLQAIDRYDLDSEASFETFAQRRVLGAMLDEINALDWTPRSVRRSIRLTLEAEAKLMARGEEVTEESLVEETGLTLDEVKTARKSSQRTFILPVDQAAMQEMEYNTDKGEESISEYFGIGLRNKSLDTNDSLEFRVSTLNILTKQEQQVIYMKYYCNEQIRHIAEVLGIPAPRVSAISRKAIQKLRKIFEDAEKY